jgi:cysteine synthase A
MTLELMRRLRDAGQQASIVAILCDGGDRYQHSYYNPEWLSRGGFVLEPWIERIASLARGDGALPLVDIVTHAQQGSAGG